MMILHIISVAVLKQDPNCYLYFGGFKWHHSCVQKYIWMVLYDSIVLIILYSRTAVDTIILMLFCQEKAEKDIINIIWMKFLWLC